MGAGMAYSNEYLMQALNFTAEDLAANKQGVMTEAQKVRFRERIGKGQTQAMVIVLIVLLISGGVIAFMLSGNEESGLRQAVEQNPTIVAIGLGGSLLLYILMMVFALLRGQRMKSGNLRVSSISGKVKLSSSELPYYSAAGAIAGAAGAQTRICEVKIGRTKIYTDETTFDALEDGGTYRLYYVGNKRAPVVVSAEVAE
jgi:hypothetical protein